MSGNRTDRTRRRGCFVYLALSLRLSLIITSLPLLLFCRWEEGGGGSGRFAFVCAQRSPLWVGWVGRALGGGGGDESWAGRGENVIFFSLASWVLLLTFALWISITTPRASWELISCHPTFMTHYDGCSASKKNKSERGKKSFMGYPHQFLLFPSYHAFVYRVCTVRNKKNRNERKIVLYSRTSICKTGGRQLKFAT